MNFTIWTIYKSFESSPLFLHYLQNRWLHPSQLHEISMIAQDIFKRIDDNQLIIRVIEKGNSHNQYRFYFICDQCGIRQRLSSSTQNIVHECPNQNQKLITNYLTCIDHV